LQKHNVQPAGAVMLAVAEPQFAAAPVAPPAPAESHTTFREVLSALNPLQYIPVVGTIYRAVTGDQIAEPLRRIGTLVVSFLMGGPVGALMNLGLFAAEKITGFDIDKTGQAALHGNLPGDPAIASATPAPAQTAAPALARAADAGLPPPLVFASVEAPPLAGLPAAPAATEAWSPAQLAAYGVSTTADGSLKLANLQGADVLNSLELSRIQMVQTAYNRATSLVH
jgi:hypothetical protein